MVREIPEVPLEERWKLVCADNMTLRGGLKDVVDYCEKVEKGEIVGTQDCLISAIKNAAKRALK